MADDLRRREAEVASKEQQLKEYALMKGEWSSLKSKVASADTRLASANKELESKEIYIRKVIKKERDTAKALAGVQAELNRLQTVEEKAAAKEKERLAAAALERASAAAEAKNLTAQLSAELQAMQQQQQVLASAAAEETSVREAEALKLKASLAGASEEQHKLQEDLARLGEQVPKDVFC